MRIGVLQKPSWIVLPAVSLTMAYGGGIAAWFIYLACTLSNPPTFHEGPYRLIETTSYWIFSGANFFLAAWLLINLAPARRASTDVRRAQFAGIAISLVFLFVLQVGAQALHHDLNENEKTDPETIAAFIAGRSDTDQRAISCVRGALKEAYPGVREALSGEALVYQHEGEFSHMLMLMPTRARLEIYGMESPPKSPKPAHWQFQPTVVRDSACFTFPLPLGEDDFVRLEQTLASLPHR
jgi:hypothetical protein